MAENHTVKPIARKKKSSTSSDSFANTVATSFSDFSSMQNQATATQPGQDAIENKSTQTMSNTSKIDSNPSLELAESIQSDATVSTASAGQSGGWHNSLRKTPTLNRNSSSSKSVLTGARSIKHASTSSLNRKGGGSSQLFYSATTGNFNGSHKRQHSSSSLHRGGFSYTGASNSENTGAVSPVIDTFAPLLYRTGSRVWESIQETKGTGHVKRTSSTTKMYILGTDEESLSSFSDEEGDTVASFHNRSRCGSKDESRENKPEDDFNPLNYKEDIIDDNLPLNFGSDSVSVLNSSLDVDDENYGADDYCDTTNSPGVGIGSCVSSNPNIGQGFAPTSNRLISAIDWLLGVDSDESLFSSSAEQRQLLQQQEQEELERRRRVALAAIPSARGNIILPRTRRKRDEEQSLNVDVSLLLGALSLVTGGDP